MKKKFKRIVDREINKNYIQLIGFDWMHITAGENDNFTLYFLDKSHKSTLNYCDKHSGKDVDKVKKCGLTPFLSDKLIDYHSLYIGKIIDCFKNIHNNSNI